MTIGEHLHLELLALPAQILIELHQPVAGELHRHHPALHPLFEQHAQHVGIVGVDGGAADKRQPGFAGELDSLALRTLVERYSEPLREVGVDVALLGCTHYPLIRSLWQGALPGVQLMQVEPAVAAQAARLWALDLAGDASQRLLSTGDPASLHAIAQAIEIPTAWG